MKTIATIEVLKELPGEVLVGITTAGIETSKWMSVDEYEIFKIKIFHTNKQILEQIF